MSADVNRTANVAIAGPRGCSVVLYIVACFCSSTRSADVGGREAGVVVGPVVASRVCELDTAVAPSCQRGEPSVLTRLVGLSLVATTVVTAA